MINIFLSAGKVFVWNVEDVNTLRTQHRIVGNLVGIPPNKQFQVQTKWLPLQLMNEEAHLLINKGFAQLISSPENIDDPSLIEEYFKKREELCEEQITILKEERKKMILDKADEIYEGKKRKFFENKSIEAKKTKSDESELNQENNLTTNETESENDTFLDKETIIEEELSKVSDVSKDMCMVQLFTEAPWKNLSANTKLNFPSSEKDKLRCAVFQDLWEKKFYITSGMKFGGDFLAYKGDPLKYHAAYIVVCLPASSRMQAIDFLTYGRLGHQVKKIAVLASFNNSGQVEYISLNWDDDL